MDTELESSQEQVLQSEESSSKTSLTFLIQLTILSVRRETLSLTKDPSVTVWLQLLNEILSRFQRCFSTSEHLPLAIQQQSEHLRCHFTVPPPILAQIQRQQPVQKFRS